MQPDLGDIVSRGFKIIWKHKVLWIPNFLQLLLSQVALLPFWSFIWSPLQGFPDGPAPPPVNRPLYTGMWIIIIIAWAIFESMAASCTIAGVARAEEGARLSLGELADEGYRYFWRILGMILSLRIFALAVLVAIFHPPPGLSRIIHFMSFPLLMLLIPAYLVANWLMIQLQVAIVVNDLNVFNAASRVFQVIKSQFGLLFIVSLIILAVDYCVGNIGWVNFIFFPWALALGHDQLLIARMLVLILSGDGLTAIAATFKKSTFTVVQLRLKRNSMEAAELAPAT